MTFQRSSATFLSQRTMRFFLHSLLTLLVATRVALAADYFVATTGRDSAAGTERAPFATLGAAQTAVRKLAGREAVTVHVAPGVYYLAQTLVFNSADTASSNAPVSYVAQPGGDVVISGGRALKLDWKPYRNGIYRAKVPENLELDQLWIQGKCQWMARFPNRESAGDHNVFDTWKLDPDAKPDPERDALRPSRIALWKNPSGGYLHAMHPALWGGIHWRITGTNRDGSLALQGGTQNNRGSGTHPVYRFVENIFEELDAPGEWYHDVQSRMLYYYPPPGLDLKQALVETVRLRHLVEMRGSLTEPVRFLTFRGFTFRQTARTFMDTREPLLRSDWTTYRGGAVFMTGTEDIDIRDCFFDQVGGNTIFVSGYNRRIQISGCRIENSGGNGVAFVGDSKSVRSPLFNYDAPFDYSKLDRTPGPLTEDYPADSTVEDCLITRTGRIEKQTAGIEIAMSRRITVRHCSIYDVPRAGINVGDGCWGGHVVEFCDIFDTVQETGDHGCWNSWGRDRYWHPDPAVVNREVAQDPALPKLDALEPTILRNNRWRCDHGWDVDLDDGSSHYRIYYNLFLNGGLKLREGYDRRVWNNITVNNSLHPHVWLANSGDLATKNIWMGAYQPAVMPEGSEKWGRFVDCNFFVAPDSARTMFVAHDCDSHSISGDPGFLNPASGDFRVREDSPAREIGFRNFPMDQFGVQKPELKRFAGTPKISPVDLHVSAEVRPAEATKTGEWLGATLEELAGKDFSAYGLAASEGGVVVHGVPAGSLAARLGFLQGDVILSVNGEPTPHFKQLVQAVSESRGGKADLEMTMVRKQARVVLPIPSTDDPPKVLYRR